MNGVFLNHNLTRNLNPSGLNKGIKRKITIKIKRGGEPHDR